MASQAILGSRITGSASTAPVFVLGNVAGYPSGAPTLQTLNVRSDGAAVMPGHGIAWTGIYEISDGVPTFTSNQGDTITLLYTNPTGQFGFTVALWWIASAVGGVTTISFTPGNAGGLNLVVAEFSPANGFVFTSTLDGTNNTSSSTSNSTASNLGAVTTTNANDLIIAAGWMGNSIPTTLSNGFVTDEVWIAPSANFTFFGHGFVTSTGTYTPHLNATPYQSVTVAIKQTAGTIGADYTALLTDNNAWTFPVGIAYAGIDAGVQTLLQSVRLSAIGGIEDAVVNCQIQGSNDPAWVTGVTTLLTISSRPVTGTLLNTYNIGAGTPYRYYRLLPSGTTYSIADIEFIGNNGGGINGAACPVVISPAGGYYDLPTYVTMSCPTVEATIYYTTDGSTPTSHSNQYVGPFLVSANASYIRAIAIAPSLSNSRVVPANFYINSIVPNDQKFEVGRGGYRMWSVGTKFVQDPVAGTWYAIGSNFDQYGMYWPGAAGVNIYSSPDLRNWTYATTILLASAGNQDGIHNSTYFGRAALVYNASTTTWILWVNSATVSGINNYGLNTSIFSYTSSSPTGPFTLAQTINSVHSVAPGGDLDVFVDAAANAWLIEHMANNTMMIAQLDTTFTLIGTAFESFTTTPFGAVYEAPAMMEISSTYYWMGSAQAFWAATDNRLSTATSPTGTWTASTRPFQASGEQNPAIAYNTQVSGLINIPGRADGFIYVGDRYAIPAPATNAIGYVNATFANWVPVSLPIVDTAGVLTISWTDNWSFLNNFAVNTVDAPSAPTGLSVSASGSSVHASWTNTATVAYALYLDRATNSGFTTGVASYVLSSGTAAFVDTNTNYSSTYFYRVRVVNASGTNVSTSQSVTTPAPPPFVSVNPTPWIEYIGTGRVI